MDLEESFKDFFVAYYDILYRQAYAIVKEEASARDIVDDTFECIWADFARLLGSKDNLLFFARRLVYNKCMDHFRHQRLHDRYAELYLRTAELSESADSDTHMERMARVMELVDELPPLTQQVLRECYFNGKHYKDVAEKLGISTNAVKKRIMSALKFFRIKLSKKSG